MSCIDEIFKWIGYIGTFIIIFRAVWLFFISNTEWINNITIKNISKDDSVEKGPMGDAIFPVSHIINSTAYSQRFLVRPNNVIIKKMKLVEYNLDKGYKHRHHKTVKVFKDLSPYKPLIIETELSELIPQYALVWYGDYGLKTEFEFVINGRDGNNNRLSGFRFKYSFLQKLRKVLGLK